MFNLWDGKIYIISEDECVDIMLKLLGEVIYLE